MTDELRLHWSLHELDERTVSLEQVLARHPEQRRAMETRRATARVAVTVLDQRVAESAKRRRVLDGEIAAFDVAHKRFERQLLAVTDQKQFEAVQREIAAVRAKRDVLETEVLELLDAEERAAAARPEKVHALERVEHEASAQFGRLETELAAATSELATLEVSRSAVTAKLAPAARTHYQKLRAARAGRAVAAVVNSSCGGCHLGLPPAVLQEARRREKLLTCDGCGRLLLMPPEDAG